MAAILLLSMSFMLNLHGGEKELLHPFLSILLK
jgi:hypothetical protein